MGSGKGSTTSTTNNSPPPEVLANYNSIMGRANNVASTPYQAYGGNLVQGFSPDQLAAFQNVNNAQTSFQPYLNTAQQYATLGASPIQASAIANYSNPYQQSVINATMGNINETDAQQQAQLLGGSLGGGGLFNDRTGVAQAELARQQDLANNQTFAGLNASNYTQALTAAQADRSAAGQAAYTFGNLGAENLQSILSASQAQLGTGGMQQQLGQAQLNVPYMQWQQQQAFPYQQTSWLAGIDTGVGSNMGGQGQTTTTPPMANQIAPYAGLGIAALGLMAKGGRIPSFADGGAPPFGAGVPSFGGGATPAIPYGGTTTYIPGSGQIAHGSGPPRASGTAQPPGAQANPFASDIKGLADLSKHFNQPTGGGIQTGGASLGLTPDEYAAASQEGSASLASPAEGFYRRGGPVKGDPSGIYVKSFADGGMPDFEDRWGDISQPNTDWGPIDQAALSPRSLGEAGTIQAGPTPPAEAPWGDMAAAPTDAASFAKPSWAASVGAGDVTPTPGGPRAWPPSLGGGDAPPIAGPGIDVGTPPGGASAGPSLGAPSPMADGQLPRGIRNNNPGNIKDSEFARSQPGYVGTDGQFARYESPAAGRAAMQALLGQYGKKGIDTVQGVVSRWAPTDDGNDVRAYSDFVAQKMGIKPGDRIDLNDPGTRAKLSSAMAQFENGQPGGLGIAAARHFDAQSGVGGGTEPSFGESPHAAPRRGGWGSPEMSGALLRAGFALMSNRSPYLAQAIGDAGQAGLGAYTEATRHGEQVERQERQEVRAEKKSDLETAKVDASIKRLEQQHEQATAALNERTKANELAARRMDETERANREREKHAQELMAQQIAGGKIPPGYRKTEEGNLEAIPGGPADPKTIAATAGAKRPALAGLTPEQREVQANQIATGNMSPLTGLPRTPEGLALRNGLRSDAAQIILQQHPEMSPAQVADHLNKQEQEFKARQIGINSGARTAGVREENLNLILRATDAAIPAAIEASEKVARTGLVPLNRIIQKGEIMTSDPDLVEFGMANLQLAEHWARAMNPTGVMRESDRDKALTFLDTGLSKGTYRRAVAQLQKQITRERDAVRGAPPSAPINPNARSPEPGEDHAAAVPPPSQRQVGTVYQTPKGPHVWLGNGWGASP